MRLGLHAIGIGAGARRAVIDEVAVAAGVLLLPEHNPVLLAKQVASLDRLSGGRLVLGVGVGWSREEFGALGIPFAGRGRRADEYLRAMRILWHEDVASFDGEFVSFSQVRVNPKPVRDRRLPVVIGGNSDAALRRVAQFGDGWYGFNLDGVDAVRERLARLDELCDETGRGLGAPDLAVALSEARPEDVAALSEAGVHELVLVEAPPEDPREVRGSSSNVTPIAATSAAPAAVSSAMCMAVTKALDARPGIGAGRWLAIANDPLALVAIWAGIPDRLTCEL